MSEAPYNPLDKKNLGVSDADALLARPASSLPPKVSFVGAGIYAIYYVGDFPAYAPIAARNRDERLEAPIYIGKAIPAGARRGGGLGVTSGPVLFRRLNEHAQSIAQAENLHLADFLCRYLVVDDIWIPLGESLLIEKFAPVWNSLIEGFGNHDPGRGRYNSQRPLWDMVHPGRPWANRLQNNKRSAQQILATLASRLSNPTQGHNA
jgi:hypothetical protein